MDKKRRGFYKNLNVLRNISQTISLLLIVMIPVLILIDIRLIIGNLYSISIFNFDISDPSIILQTSLISGKLNSTLIISSIIPLLIALLFGRVFCSWICPYNTLSELVGFILNKFYKGNKIAANRSWVFTYSSLLISILIILFTGFSLFNYLALPGLLSFELAAIIMGHGVGLGLALIISVLLIENLMQERFWCKFICPSGIILSLFRTKKTLKINFNNSLCRCGSLISPCSQSCPLQLDPKQKNLYPSCINCGKCLKACENTGNEALTFTLK